MSVFLLGSPAADAESWEARFAAAKRAVAEERWADAEREHRATLQLAEFEGIDPRDLARADHALDGDPTKVARYQVRFAGVVFPGETIVTSLWREGKQILIQAKTKERDTPVITNAAITVRN
jgi:acyl dehydratase